MEPRQMKHLSAAWRQGELGQAGVPPALVPASHSSYTGRSCAGIPGGGHPVQRWVSRNELHCPGKRRNLPFTP